MISIKETPGHTRSGGFRAPHVRQGERPAPTDAVDLIDAIPQRDLDVTLLPEPLQRAVYDILHLELRYQPGTHQLTLRITLSADTAKVLTQLTGTHAAEQTDNGPHNQAHSPVPGGMFWEPPVGIEPTTYALRVRRSVRLS